MASNPADQWPYPGVEDWGDDPYAKPTHLLGDVRVREHADSVKALDPEAQERVIAAAQAVADGVMRDARNHPFRGR